MMRQEQAFDADNICDDDVVDGVADDPLAEIREDWIRELNEKW